MKQLKQLLYLPTWFIKTRIFGKKIPMQTVLFINDLCNLTCKHCTIYNNKTPITKSYQQIREELIYSYNLGSRYVDLEGGEPTLWKEADKNFNSLVRLAKEIGFFSVTLTTNAFLPFNDSESDSIWVSLDGNREYHDQIRGKNSFDRLDENIRNSGHPRVSVNMVVNSINYSSVAETIQFAKDHPNIKSISINFHTPFKGTEHLFLPFEQRNEVIDLVIKMKKSGYPIMNSVSGLKAMKDLNFKKVCWVTNFIMVDATKYAECQGKAFDLCDSCGFCMAGEMHSVFSFKLDTIFAGLKLRG
ncbi:MAG: radical SAM protein [Candidatus Kapabacteria bacterium]|nr:radical SAM protein [Candidatus Kapabacteria bacterium]